MTNMSLFFMKYILLLCYVEDGLVAVLHVYYVVSTPDACLDFNLCIIVQFSKTELFIV